MYFNSPSSYRGNQNHVAMYGVKLPNVENMYCWMDYNCLHLNQRKILQPFNSF